MIAYRTSDADLRVCKILFTEIYLVLAQGQSKGDS